MSAKGAVALSFPPTMALLTETLGSLMSTVMTLALTVPEGRL